MRRRAARTLSLSTDAPSLVESLIALLEDEDVMVRRTAIAALGRVGDARALEPLRALGIAARDESDGRALAAQARKLVEERLAERAATTLSRAESRSGDTFDVGDRRLADAIRKAAAARKGRFWASIRRRFDSHRQRTVSVGRALILAFALWGAWELRVLVRPLYMVFLMRHPALTSIPLLTGGAAFLAHMLVKVARRRAREGGSQAAPAAAARRDWRRRWNRTRPLLGGPTRSFLVCGAFGLLVAAAMTSAWTGAAIYAHNAYGPLSPAMLEGGEVRIKPYEVAQRQTENGLNSPTEHATNLHVVKVDGRLTWTSIRDPEGLFRVLTKATKGVMSVDASSSQPNVRQSGARYDAGFRYGPGMRISDSIRWRIYKKMCYGCDVAEMSGVPTADGPLIIAPYIRYKGNWFVRRPTLGGSISFTPTAASTISHPRRPHATRAFASLAACSRSTSPGASPRRTSTSAGSGTPSSHTDQLSVADTEENRQPFLQDFDGLGPQWVTTLKPRGRTFTTAGLMTTDAVSGRTGVWLAGPDRSLIGNQKAVEIVRGESFQESSSPSSTRPTREASSAR